MSGYFQGFYTAINRPPKLSLELTFETQTSILLQFSRSPGCFIKYCTTINLLAFIFRHGSRSRLGAKDSVIAMLLQLWQEETVELFRFYFLNDK
jgi:hypothetical protein